MSLCSVLICSRSSSRERRVRERLRRLSRPVGPPKNENLIHTLNRFRNSRTATTPKTRTGTFGGHSGAGQSTTSCSGWCQMIGRCLLQLSPVGRRVLSVCAGQPALTAVLYPVSPPLFSRCDDRGLSKHTGYKGQHEL